MVGKQLLNEWLIEYLNTWVPGSPTYKLMWGLDYELTHLFSFHKVELRALK